MNFVEEDRARRALRPGELVKVSELNLGDLIDFDFPEGGYGSATVVKVSDKKVEVFRPFVHVAGKALRNA